MTVQRKLLSTEDLARQQREAAQRAREAQQKAAAEQARKAQQEAAARQAEENRALGADALTTQAPAADPEAGRDAVLDRVAPEGDEDFDSVFADKVEEAQDILADSPEADMADRGDGVSGESGFRRREHDGLGANQEDAEVDAAAREAVEANRKAEDAALRELSPEDRERYERVAGAMEDDPRGQLALQGLLMNGRLTADPPAVDGQNMLAALDRMAEPGAVAEPLDAGELIADTVLEVFQPTAIDQSARGTCAATSVQIALAMENPAEYTRLVSSLAASGDGSTQLANGDTIRRYPGTESDDESGRSLSSRLVQTAFMDYANGGDDYENTPDGGGLDAGEVERLMEGVSGRGADAVYVNKVGIAHWLTPDTEVGRGELMDRIEDELASGRPVLVGMAFAEADSPEDFRDASHKVVVTKMEGDRVYYNNPWGIEESMTRDEFESRLKNANFGSFSPTDEHGAASERVSDGLDGLAGKAPGSEDHREALDDVLSDIDEDDQSHAARRDLEAIASHYEQAGDSGRAEVLRRLAGTEGIPVGVQRDVIRALQDNDSTEQDLEDALGHADGNLQALELIVAAAEATGQPVSDDLRSALDEARGS